MRKNNRLTVFGKQVKIRLLELDMEAQELAFAIGTSPVQLSRILHGIRPGKEQAAMIADILNIEYVEGEGA